MNKIFILIIALVLMGLTSPKISAQEVNASTTATWAFDLGTDGQQAIFSDGTADFFNSNYVTVGTNLTLKDYNTTYDITYTRFQPEAQLGAASADNLVSFNLRPKTGLNFTPDAVSFDCMRFGTDGGKIDVAWRSSEGNSTVISTEIIPARNNSGAGTHVDLDLSSYGLEASTGACGLEIYIYTLGDTKQAGLANITITGTVKGSIVDVASYTLTTGANPPEAGSVSTFPVGTIFDENTELMLTADRNFGYQFSHWVNEAGENVSSNNSYTFVLTKNEKITAVFNPINTYSLTVHVNGGANPYMVTAAPDANVIDGKAMYEDGTVVTLSAAGNPIVKFTNWESGETSADLTVTMVKDQDVTAEYSAVDFIVGWDFYQPGNNGRMADFISNTDNEAASLILRNAEGNIVSWLDKSQVSAGGYEGAPAAVNWSPLVDKNYYQISFNAKDFSDISVSSSMLFNYNAYSIQMLEYSVDGENFSLIGNFEMTAGKVWYTETFLLPKTADHAENIVIRWIPDYTSGIVGSTSSNDGTAISAIYITGTATIFNDGTAPVLSKSVPAKNATGASATGKVVLTFDEKVKITESVSATLGDQTLVPSVSGKTITFAYSGLDYDMDYTFSLLGNVIADLAGNALTTPITIKFHTMAHPTVVKKNFDFIVGIDGDFKAALDAAKTASAGGTRFYIFFPNGEYNIGALTGDGNQMTAISIPNVSYIGESADGVILYNKSIQESINSTATIYFTGSSSNIYMQDISLMNKMDYRTGSLSGRGVALWDKGAKNIYKNVNLLSNQDTYYTGDERSYLETCEIHGTVDFICGGGDLFFNECLIYLEDRSGNVITAPASNGQWGYVFNNCTIDGFDSNKGSYRLGRPWSNSPKSVFINTTMKVLPTAVAWGDPMNVVPSVFAEYNSMTASGTPVDLSGRRTTYTKDAVTVTLSPVLTEEQAAEYTIENVLGGSDAWQPNRYTEQAAPPVVSNNGNTLSWQNSDYVLCWSVAKDGQFVQFTTVNSYDIPDETASGSVFTIRSVNEMGGLGAASNEYAYQTSVQKLERELEVVEKQYYTIYGQRIASPRRGINIVLTRYEDGTVSTSKIFKSME
ncbi:MAG: pectinesterase family protein [Prolixibacteraceae bacterium]